ncbi:hypothetical protein FA09DRAFT_76306 [Tilletiopsis washingtonensis]|uniref:Uncharacterized protein n=1 Tax=Tilletiopsis washingtonensis TaxID=58919 RepID=A0A316Z5G6_9BASI|nr:hypothetical protein FA09DRAFT_76306 [Tilletiopsis washingtonensis]PWN96546.1 hypothetical protein FA09DRAFT_76306 [Tilletiopsis washingtonensis]
MTGERCLGKAAAGRRLAVPGTLILALLCPSTRLSCAIVHCSIMLRRPQGQSSARPSPRPPRRLSGRSDTALCAAAVSQRRAARPRHHSRPLRQPARGLAHAPKSASRSLQTQVSALLQPRQ